MNDHDAARLFVEAFDADSIQAWIGAIKAWDDRRCAGPLGAAVKHLRETFFHDGTDRARANCRAARDAILRAIKYAERHAKESAR